MPELKFIVSPDVNSEDRQKISDSVLALISSMENMSKQQLHGTCGVMVVRNRGRFGKIKRLYELEVT